MKHFLECYKNCSWSSSKNISRVLKHPILLVNCELVQVSLTHLRNSPSSCMFHLSWIDRKNLGVKKRAKFILFASRLFFREITFIDNFLNNHFLRENVITLQRIHFTEVSSMEKWAIYHHKEKNSWNQFTILYGVVNAFISRNFHTVRNFTLSRFRQKSREISH